MFEEREGLKLSPILFPALISNRRRETLTVSNFDELIAHVDCDSRFDTIRNLLAARVKPDNELIDPWSLLTDESKHMLNLYAKQRRYGMCFLFKDWSECPIGVQIAFDTIAHTVETKERKLTSHGSRTSGTNSKSRS